MRLSKKQEKAIETALYVLGVALDNRLNKDEEELFSEAVDELAKMKDKSLMNKAKEKQKKNV